MGTQAGLSLVEVIVAVAIIAIALAPLVGMFASSRKSLEASSRRTEVAALARQCMDEALDQPFDSIATIMHYGFDPAGEYDCEVVVTTSADSADYFKTVKVALLWTERGEERRVELVSGISKR